MMIKYSALVDVDQIRDLSLHCGVVYTSSGPFRILLFLFSARLYLFSRKPMQLLFTLALKYVKQGCSVHEMLISSSEFKGAHPKRCTK